MGAGLFSVRSDKQIVSDSNRPDQHFPTGFYAFLFPQLAEKRDLNRKQGKGIMITDQ